MPTPTLIATPGAVNANSYCTVAEADTYHDSRLHAEQWRARTVATKTVALINATRLMDVMWEWVERPTTLTQILQWPRVGMLKRNKLELVPDNVIPPELRDSVAEFAFQLLPADRTLDSDIEAQGIKSVSAGPVSVTFRDGTIAPKVVPDAVWSLIPPWWGTLTSRLSTVRELVRA